MSTNTGTRAASTATWSIRSSQSAPSNINSLSRRPARQAAVRLDESSRGAKKIAEVVERGPRSTNRQ